MKCEHCGTENNFEWSTFCRSCHEPLHIPQDGGKFEAQETTKINIKDQNSQPAATLELDDEKIEIGVSDPMDYIMGSSKGLGQHGENESSEDIEPEPIENELTLYRDQNMKLSIAETVSGPKVTMEPLSNEAPEIGPGYVVESLHGLSDTSLLQSSDTPLPSEPNEQPSQPLSPDCPPEREQLMATQRIDLDQVARQERKMTESRNPQISADTLGQVKHSAGVIYLSGKNLKVTGGVRVIPGDQIKINDKEFKVKTLPKGGTKFYLAICGGAIAVFLLVLIAFSAFRQDKGQLAGIITGADNRPLSGKTVRIAELGTSGTTNLAGFFTFDGMSSGIYTLEYQNEDNSWAKETVTVLKGRTSTITLKESRPQLSVTQPPTSDITTGQSDKNVISTKTDKGNLKLNLNPSTASAFLNGKPLGAGSNSYNLNPGTYTLTVKKQGYKESAQKITIESDKALSLRISLVEDVQATRDTKSDTQAGYEQELAGNFKDALNYYSRALAKDPRDVNALLGKARCAKVSGNTEDATTYFSQAAKAAAEKGDLNSQAAALTGIIEIKPNTFTAYATRGEILYGKGDYARAIDDFSRVIELDARNLSAYYKLGNSFYYSNRYPEALKSFQAAQELNFADPRAEAYIAKTYLAMGDKRNSKKAYMRFKELASYSAQLEFRRDPEWQKVLTALGETE